MISGTLTLAGTGTPLAALELPVGAHRRRRRASPRCGARGPHPDPGRRAVHRTRGGRGEGDRGQRADHHRGRARRRAGRARPGRRGRPTRHRPAGRRRRRWTFAPRSDAPGKLHMALGSGSVLVSGGKAVDFPPSTGNDAPKPRTAVAWPAGGHRLLLVAVDGSAELLRRGSASTTWPALLVRGWAPTRRSCWTAAAPPRLVARRPGDSAASASSTRPRTAASGRCPTGWACSAARARAGCGGWTCARRPTGWSRG